MSLRLVLLAVPLAALAAEAPPLGLREALQAARASGPDAEVVLARVEAAEARAAQSDARLLPYVGLRAGYEATNHAGRGFGMILAQRSFDPSLDFNRPGVIDGLSAGVELRHRLLASGADLAASRAAERTAGAARALSLAELRALDLTVASALERVRVADVALEATRLAADAAAQVLSNAERREAAGSLLRSERLRVAAEKARAEDAWHLARLARTDAAGGLQILLGRDPSLPVNLAAAESPSAAAASASTVVPEVLAAAEARAAAEASADAARRAHGPTLDLVADWGHDRGFRRDGEGDAWSAGLVFRLPLYEGGGASARVREAVAARRSAAAAEAKALAVAAHRLAIAHQSAEVQRDREAAARINLAQAEEASRLSRLRFDAGQLLATEWAAAESALAEARLRLADASSSHRLALLVLRVAQGREVMDDLSR
jgi:outer membrane protein TolC